MTIKTPWSRLVRFIAEDDQIYYGDVVTDDPEFDVGAATKEEPSSLRAKIIEGDPLSKGCKVTERVEVVKQLLGPFTRDSVPAIRCIGGNYAEHRASSHILAEK